MKRLAVGLTAAALLLAGCGGSSDDESAPVAPATTEAAETEAAETETEAPEVDDPETPDEILAALKAAGLPIGAVRVYNESTDPNKLLGRPGQYTGKANFRDQRLEPTANFSTDGGGSVETFDNEADAKRRYEYVKAIATSSSLFAEYDYIEGDVVLRLSHILTPAQAGEYERAFRDVV